MDETFSDPAGMPDPASGAAVPPRVTREHAELETDGSGGAAERLRPTRTRPSSPRDASLRATGGRRRRGDGTPELFPGAFDRPGSAEESAPIVEETPATETEAENLRGALEACLESEQFLTWFQRSRLIAHAGREAIVAVPNGFARNWIEKYYMESLQRCVEAVLGRAASRCCARAQRVAVPEQARAGRPALRGPRAART